MRTLFKILLFPIIAILTVLSLGCRLITVVSGTIIGTISSLLFLFTIVCLAMGFAQWEQAKGLLLLCLVFSEIGLFGLANLLLNGVDCVTRKLRQV